MRILAVDIGTGTQDILLFDSSKIVENCIKMVMPSPTAIIAGKISKATTLGKPIVLTGITMGGGPNKRALSRHIHKGLAVYATEEAALTFNDDLDVVVDMGINIIPPDDLDNFSDVEVIELKDLDIEVICRAIESFGVDSSFNALAVAVLDHGFAPPGMSNRRFRFSQLQKHIEKRNELLTFAFLKEEISDNFTRMKAVAGSVGMSVPLLLLDTGVAATLGALRDSQVCWHDDLVTVNMGNSHTIAFHMHGEFIQGLFEHHTGRLNTSKLDSLISKLVQGTITNDEVFEDGGHGAVVVGDNGCQPAVVLVGPRCDVMMGSSFSPHRAVPYGDTMLTGCYGLVSACALRMENWREEIEKALSVNS